MAAAQHKLSRRTLLGAALTPLILSGAEPRRSPVSKDPSPSSENWNRALAAFRRAEATVKSAESCADDELFDRLLGRSGKALRHLLRTSAPDLAALATKIELVVDLDVASLAGGEPCLSSLKRDARRLASCKSVAITDIRELRVAALAPRTS